MEGNIKKLLNISLILSILIIISNTQYDYSQVRNLYLYLVKNTMYRSYSIKGKFFTKRWEF